MWIKISPAVPLGAAGGKFFNLTYLTSFQSQFLHFKVSIFSSFSPSFSFSSGLGGCNCSQCTPPADGYGSIIQFQKKHYCVWTRMLNFASIFENSDHHPQPHTISASPCLPPPLSTFSCAVKAQPYPEISTGRGKLGIFYRNNDASNKSKKKLLHGVILNLDVCWG